LNDIEIRDVDSACIRCYFRRVPDMDRRRVIQFAGVGAFAAAIPVPLARASASKQDQLAAPWAARAVQSSTATLFADEFDGPAGSVPDYAKWTVARGTSGDGRRNVFLDGNSNLVVRATREGDRYVGGSLAANWRAGGGTTWEARVKLESLAAPCWPAQWLATDGPARVGEVDSTGWRGSIELPSGATAHPLAGGSASIGCPMDMDGQWHTWRCGRDEGGVSFWRDYVDGAQPFHRIPMASMTSSSFKIPSFQELPVLSLAVDGTRGADAGATVRPAQMLVDWVRVW